MYILRETNEAGEKNEFTFSNYEEARRELDKRAEADKAAQVGPCEIKHGEEHYSRVTLESQKWYILDIVDG